MSSELGHQHQQPDELYTLRTQYYLGHYTAALLEAKQMSRRPISSNELKLEREEYIVRCYIALQQYDKCMNNTTTTTDSPGLKALKLKAQFESAIGNETVQMTILDEMKSLASSHPTIVTVQLYTAQVCLLANETSIAYSLVSSSTHVNTSPECMALKLQILLKIDRIDLAQRELQQLHRLVGDESVLVELCTIYISFALGKSKAADAEHTITTLSEQYGPSVFLLNLLAMSLCIQGNLISAENKLLECLRDYKDEMTSLQHCETLYNLMVVYYQQPSTKMNEGHATLQQLLTFQPMTSCSHQFKTNYERVVTAFDRETTRYMSG